MTCIVGLVDGGCVYMGADSAVSEPSGPIRTMKDPKVFRRGDALIGCSGDLRALQLLCCLFNPPAHKSGVDDLTYLVTSFTDALRAMHRKKGILKKDGEVEVHDSHLLVGYRGSLYSVEADFQAYRTAEPWAAAGSGSDLALGSMYSTAKLKMGPKHRILLALEAAEAYNNAVRGPFYVTHMKVTKR